MEKEGVDSENEEDPDQQNEEGEEFDTSSETEDEDDEDDAPKEPKKTSLGGEEPTVFVLQDPVQIIDEDTQTKKTPSKAPATVEAPARPRSSENFEHKRQLVRFVIDGQRRFPLVQAPIVKAYLKDQGANKLEELTIEQLVELVKTMRAESKSLSRFANANKGLTLIDQAANSLTGRFGYEVPGFKTALLNDTDAKTALNEVLWELDMHPSPMDSPFFSLVSSCLLIGGAALQKKKKKKKERKGKKKVDGTKGQEQNQPSVGTQDQEVQ